MCRPATRRQSPKPDDGAPTRHETTGLLVRISRAPAAGYSAARYGVNPDRSPLGDTSKINPWRISSRRRSKGEAAMRWYSAQTRIGTAVVFATLATVGAPPPAAMTMQECSAKYRAAQASGSLGQMTWLDFRKSNCGTNPAMGYTATTFPKGISPKYKNEPVGKARMHTCLD